jgi:AcrR family transcriptional regulator
MPAGRKRSFDEDQVLERAMQVFWRQGYAGTSLSDLTEALGINKPSLYAAFGNKEQLFARALSRYGRAYGLPHAERLLAPADAPLRERLRAYLQSVAGMLTDPELPGGCFIATTSCEAGGGGLPAAAQSTLSELNRGTRRMLTEIFEQARANGAVAADRQPDALAAYTMSLMMGMAVMARDGADLDTLRSVIDQAVRTL